VSRTTAQLIQLRPFANDHGKTQSALQGAPVKVTLVGSRWFGSAALAMMLDERFEVPRVIAAAVDDRLVTHAKEAGLDIAVQDNPHVVPGSAVPEETDLIVTAHNEQYATRAPLIHEPASAD
jgi:predicted homoserine dehydrogenase-like protein